MYFFNVLNQQNNSFDGGETHYSAASEDETIGHCHEVCAEYIRWTYVDPKELHLRMTTQKPVETSVTLVGRDDSYKFMDDYLSPVLSDRGYV